MNLESLSRSAQPQELVINQPAAGAEWSVTVPAGQMWRVDTLYYVLTTSAVVANRFSGITITDGSNIVWRGDAGGNGLPASQVNPFSATRLAGAGTGNSTSVNAAQHTFLPDVWLPGGYVIASLTVNKDVGDQFSAVRGLIVASTDT